jgi:hypothetical protein
MVAYAPSILPDGRPGSKRQERQGCSKVAAKPQGMRKLSGFLPKSYDFKAAMELFRHGS